MACLAATLKPRYHFVALQKVFYEQTSYRLVDILYIANRSRWRSFAVAKLNCNSLENICGWTVVLYGQSLFIAQVILH